MGLCCSKAPKKAPIYREDEFSTCQDHSDLSDIDEFEPSASEQLVDAALEVYACPALAGVEASPQEWAALDCLWDLIGETHDDLVTDAVLLRFLRARELKVEDAHLMLSKWVQCREEFGVDSLTEQHVQAEAATKKAMWIGIDRSNRPCLLIRPRLHIPEESTPTEMVRYGVWVLE